MDVLKKHYEKIILGVVLLGLAAAAALLPFKVSALQEELDKVRVDLFNNPNPKVFKPLDLTNHLADLVRVRSFTNLDFGLPHRLFNPVQWERKGTTLIKHSARTGTGPEAVMVLSVAPLYYEVTFVEVSGSEDLLRYKISTVRQTEKNARPRTHLLKLNERADQFVLKGIKGEKDSPTELLIEVVDEKKTITVGKDQPFRALIGYTADLRYEPENKTWLKARKDDKLQIAKATYKIIDINETEVVLSEEPTGTTGKKEAGSRTILTVPPKN